MLVIVAGRFLILKNAGICDKKRLQLAGIILLVKIASLHEFSRGLKTPDARKRKEIATGLLLSFSNNLQKAIKGR